MLKPWPPNLRLHLTTYLKSTLGNVKCITVRSYVFKLDDGSSRIQSNYMDIDH
jgi:hypothetical protein